jgi:glutamate 5-kinase
MEVNAVSAVFHDHSKIVIKIGSSSLTHTSGRIDLYKMEKLVKQIANLYNQGKSIILVSSGAIAAGVGKMRLPKRPDNMPEKQAAAAVGQTTLMHMYEKFFSEYGITVAQVLLTKEDMKSQARRTHCINALDALTNHQIIPIVNENDVVAVDEIIKFGENDTLSAEVCALMDYDGLIILSDIDGVYNKDPHHHPDAFKIDVIDSLETMTHIAAGGSGSAMGTGGMQTKFKAAQMLAAIEKDMLVINSQSDNILNRIFLEDAVGTVFNFSKRRRP